MLELTNHFPYAIDDVTVEVVSAGNIGLALEDPLQTGVFSPGETITVHGTLSCSGQRTETVDLKIVGGGEHAKVVAHRSVEITCLPPETLDVSHVTFRGTGNVNPIATEEDRKITVDVIYYDGKGQPGPGSDEFDAVCNVTTFTNGPIQPDLPGGTTGIVAVYVHEADGSYYHPEFDPATTAIDNWGQGTQNGVLWTGSGSERSSNHIGVIFDQDLGCGPAS